MPLDPLTSPFTARYCMQCGAALIFTELDIQADSQEVATTCSGCGNEGWQGWSKSGRSTRALLIAEDGSSKIVKATSAISPAQLEEMQRATAEAQEQHERLFRPYHEQGVVGFFSYPGFPLFALAATPGQLLPTSHSFGSPGITWAYVGPAYGAAVEAVHIAMAEGNNPLQPANWRTSSPSGAARRAITDPLRHVLTSLQAFKQLWENFAFYQYLNINRFVQAPVSTATVTLRSGETTTWQIKHLDEPVPIAFAWTLIEQTDVTVSAAGPCATRMAELLAQLTRLTPGCPEIAHLDAGFAAYGATLRDQ